MMCPPLAKRPPQSGWGRGSEQGTAPKQTCCCLAAAAQRKKCCARGQGRRPGKGGWNPATRWAPGARVLGPRRGAAGAVVRPTPPQHFCARDPSHSAQLPAGGSHPAHPTHAPAPRPPDPLAHLPSQPSRAPRQLPSPTLAHFSKKRRGPLLPAAGARYAQGEHTPRLPVVVNRAAARGGPPQLARAGQDAVKQHRQLSPRRSSSSSARQHYARPGRRRGKARRHGRARTGAGASQEDEAAQM